MVSTKKIVYQLLFGWVLLNISIVFSCAPRIAQSAQIEPYEIVKGQITKFETKGPLSNANVCMLLDSGEKIGAIPDQNGHYELKSPIGKHTLQAISADNYSKTTIPVTVTEGGGNKFDLVISGLDGKPRKYDKPITDKSDLLKPKTYKSERDTNQILALVKGTIKKAEIHEPLSNANVCIYPKNGGVLCTISDQNGNYELKSPIGKHPLQVTHAKTKSHPRTQVTVKQGVINKRDMDISGLDTNPWDYSEPYVELAGFWKPINYINGADTIDQIPKKDQSGVYFYFPSPENSGKLSWRQNCNYCGTTYFRHIGEGVIEFQKRDIGCSAAGCSWNMDMARFIWKMLGEKVTSQVTNSGQKLELSLGNEKFVFQKIHDNTKQRNNDELFGNWSLMEAKYKGEKIGINKGAQVLFNMRNGGMGTRKQAIEYKDPTDCIDGVRYAYWYEDEDFISLINNNFSKRDVICKAKFPIYNVFSYFTAYGCNIKLDETRKTVTLEYEETLLLLQRI